VLAIIAVLSNAQSWTKIEAFGEAKEEWLNQWLALETRYPHTIPPNVFSD
jgi:hypothetical protein